MKFSVMSLQKCLAHETILTVTSSRVQRKTQWLPIGPLCLSRLAWPSNLLPLIKTLVCITWVKYCSKKNGCQGTFLSCIFPFSLKMNLYVMRCRTDRLASLIYCSIPGLIWSSRHERWTIAGTIFTATHSTSNKQ